MSSQRIGKYACLEIERRYLLEKIPTDLEINSNGWFITDRYLPDTSLRLRRMKSLIGNEIIYKLTQKYQSEDQDASHTTVTNTYLSEMEYQLLERLKAKVLIKKRFRYKVHNRTYSIDIFEGRHQGLILAEIEFENESKLVEMTLPPFAFKDVTNDPFFTGGNLVTISEIQFRQGLAKYL